MGWLSPAAIKHRFFNCPKACNTSNVPQAQCRTRNEQETRNPVAFVSQVDFLKDTNTIQKKETIT